MTLLIDTGALVAGADAADPHCETIENLFASYPGPLVIPAPVTAEIDYLLGERLGEQPRRSFLDDLAAGRFVVECLTGEDYRLALEVERQYAALELSLADLSLVVLARKLETRTIATFDERDFRAVKPLQGGVFQLLPADG